MGQGRRARDGLAFRARRVGPRRIRHGPRVRGGPEPFWVGNTLCARGKAAARAAALPHSLWGNTPCATGNAAGRAAALALCGIARSPRRARPQRFDCGGRRARGGAAELAALDVDAKGVIGLRKPRAHAARGRRARRRWAHQSPRITERENWTPPRARARSRAHTYVQCPRTTKTTYSSTEVACTSARIQFRRIYHCMRVRACVYICVYIFICMYMYMYVYKHTCVYIDCIVRSPWNIFQGDR